jgi:hypothetical protein
MDEPSCPPEDKPMSHRAMVHYGSAILFFICLVIVCILSAFYASTVVKDKRVEELYRYAYYATAALMGLSLLISLILFATDNPSAIYYSECGGVNVFCVYWIIKLLEFNYISNHPQKP